MVARSARKAAVAMEEVTAMAQASTFASLAVAAVPKRPSKAVGEVGELVVRSVERVSTIDQLLWLSNCSLSRMSTPCTCIC